MSQLGFAPLDIRELALIRINYKNRIISFLPSSWQNLLLHYTKRPGFLQIFISWFLMED